MHSKGLFGCPFLPLPALHSFVHLFIHSFTQQRLPVPFPEPSGAVREAGDSRGCSMRRNAQGSRPWLERVLALTQFLESEKGLGHKKKRGPANGQAGYGPCTIEMSHHMEHDTKN